MQSAMEISTSDDNDDVQLERRAPTISARRVIDQIDSGKFQVMVLCVTGVALASDASSMMVMTFIVPNLASWEMAEEGKAVLTSGVFAGMLFGGLLAGILADMFGRRRILLFSMIMAQVFGALTAASTSLYMLVFARLLTGVGVGGAMPVVFAYGCEMFVSSRVNVYIYFLSTFWLVGSLLCAVLAWAIIPTSGWQIFSGVASLPCIVAAVGTFFLPESPLWLVEKGRTKEAIAVLKFIAKLNGTVLPAHVTEESLVPNDDGSASDGDTVGSDDQARMAIPAPRDEDLADLPGLSLNEGYALAGTSVHSDVRSMSTCNSLLLLVNGKYIRRRFFLLLGMWAFLNFGWYALMLWLPSILERYHLNMDLYTAALFTQAGSLPGYIICVCLHRRISPRMMMICATALSAGSAIGFAFGNSCWNSLNAMSPISFPVPLRATAMGLLTVTGRIATIASQFLASYLVSNGMTTTLLLVSAATMIIACVIALFFPVNSKPHIIDHT